MAPNNNNNTNNSHGYNDSNHSDNEPTADDLAAAGFRSQQEAQEFRRKLSSLADYATPEVLETLASKAMEMTLREMRPTQPPPPARCEGSSPREVLTIRVRQSQACNWCLEHWEEPCSDGGKRLVGRLLERSEASTMKLELSSFQDLLDIAKARSTAATVARKIAFKRVIMSGNLRSTASRFAPVLRVVLPQLALELPDEADAVNSINENSLRTTTSQSSGMVSWLPDEASTCCLVCGGAWVPLIRHRHHCRSCGTLVCGRCSSRRSLGPSGNYERRCRNCIAGERFSGLSSPAIPTAFSSVTSRSSVLTVQPPQPAASRRQLPFQSDTALAQRATDVPGPELPPESRAKGVLLAQVDSSFGFRLKTIIEAAPPSESEQRLWRRLLDAEASLGLKTAKQGQSLLKSLTSALHSYCLQVGLVCWVVFAVTELRLDSFLAMYLPARVLLLSWFCSLWFLLSGTSRRLLKLGLLVQAVRHRAACFGALFVLWTSILSWTRGDPTSSDLAGEALASSELFLCFAVKEHYWTILFGLLALIRVLRASWRLGRLLSVYSVAFVPILVYWICGRLQKWFGWSDAVAQERLYDPADSLMAPYISKGLGVLGGLFVKVGQWISNIAFGVPIKLQEGMKELVDSAVIDDEAHVRQTVLEEFGGSIEDLFEEFSIKPLASASIAQVHSAYLKIGDGGERRRVAVKLQHAGVEELILLDLKALKQIVDLCCWLGGEKWNDVKRMIESWSSEMVKELDFANEVKNLREVREGLEKAGLDVVVPRELDGWVSRRAFVMEFCEGFRFTDLDRLILHGVDRKGVAERALHATAAQLLEIGVFNSDPHAGNLLCQVNGDRALPVLLDFGNCICLTLEQRVAYCNLLVGISELSITKTREALNVLGLHTTQSKDKPDRDLQYMLLMFRDTGSRESQRQGQKQFGQLRKKQREEDLIESGAKTEEEKKKAKKENQRYPTQLPDEFLLFMRMMSLVRGLCTQLDVELPLMKIFEFHGRRGLIGLHPAPQRALTWQTEAQGENQQKHPQLWSAVRRCIADSCAARPGLGVQVSVHLGKECIIDECGGVLGAVDPRPVSNETLFPLAELSKLPVLLAAARAHKEGLLSHEVAVRDLLQHLRGTGTDDPKSSSSTSSLPGRANSSSSFSEGNSTSSATMKTSKFFMTKGKKADGDKGSIVCDWKKLAENAEVVRGSVPARYAAPTWCLEKLRNGELEDFAKGVIVYYSDGERLKDVEAVVEQREPCHKVDGLTRCYQQEKMEAAFGYSIGAYSRSTASRLMPNIVVYCETPLLLNGKERVAHVANAVGYCFGSSEQPDWKYFLPLSQTKRWEELVERQVQLYAQIFECARRHDLRRIYLSDVGGGELAQGLSWTSSTSSDKSYATLKSTALDRLLKEQKSRIEVLPLRSPCRDFLANLSDEDLRASLLVNPCNPWSLFGNTNGQGRDLESEFGQVSCISYLCWPLTNPFIRYESVRGQGPRLKHALTHRALLTPASSLDTVEEELQMKQFARGKLANIPAPALGDVGIYSNHLLKALSPRPLPRNKANYFPLGAGMLAAATLEMSLGEEAAVAISKMFPRQDTVFQESEFSLRPLVQAANENVATLSSMLFTDFRGMMAGMAAQAGGDTSSPDKPGLSTPSQREGSAPPPAQTGIKRAAGGGGAVSSRFGLKQDTDTRSATSQSTEATIQSPSASATTSLSRSDNSSNNNSSSNNNNSNQSSGGSSSSTRKEASASAPSLVSVLDGAGGLLVDLGLACAVAAGRGSEGSQPTKASKGSRPQATSSKNGSTTAQAKAKTKATTGAVAAGASATYDLGAYSSARALAAFFAAEAPAKTAMSTEALNFASERKRTSPEDETNIEVMVASQLGLAQRQWDEHGFEVFFFFPEASGRGCPVAVGLTSCAGLLGLAIQYRPADAQHLPTTIVVLTNEMGIAKIPHMLLNTVAEQLRLPLLTSFSD